jgi:hypothetical protein
LKISPGSNNRAYQAVEGYDHNLQVVEVVEDILNRNNQEVVDTA